MHSFSFLIFSSNIRERSIQILFFPCCFSFTHDTTSISTILLPDMGHKFCYCYLQIHELILGQLFWESLNNKTNLTFTFVLYVRPFRYYNSIISIHRHVLGYSFRSILRSDCCVNAIIADLKVAFKCWSGRSIINSTLLGCGLYINYNKVNIFYQCTEGSSLY